MGAARIAWTRASREVEKAPLARGCLPSVRSLPERRGGETPLQIMGGGSGALR